MKTIVKVPKSVKRMLATMDKTARSHYLKLFVEAIAQDATRSKRMPANIPANDND
jgi:hypothetical protein